MNNLLKYLDTDGRLTTEQLSVMAGMNEEDVKKQLLRWEKEGVIRGYKAIIDWEKTDREYVTAIIELHVTPKKGAGFEEIAKTVADFEEVESIYLMSGGYDFSIVVTGKTFREVAMFVANRLSTLDSVVSTATHFVLRRYKEKNVKLFGEDADEREEI